MVLWRGPAWLVCPALYTGGGLSTFSSERESLGASGPGEAFSVPPFLPASLLRSKVARRVCRMLAAVSGSMPANVICCSSA